MSLMQMQAVLRIIYAHEKVIGVDITGECSATLDYLSEVKDASVNNRANEELMKMILTEECCLRPYWNRVDHVLLSAYDRPKRLAKIH